MDRLDHVERLLVEMNQDGVHSIHEIFDKLVAEPKCMPRLRRVDLTKIMVGFNRKPDCHYDIATLDDRKALAAAWPAPTEA